MYFQYFFLSRPTDVSNEVIKLINDESKNDQVLSLVRNPKDPSEIIVQNHPTMAVPQWDVILVQINFIAALIDPFPNPVLLIIKESFRHVRIKLMWLWM